jgi:peptidyl-prolyl cis-trans isomerase D
MLSYIRKRTENWGLKVFYFVIALTFLGGFGGLFGILKSCGTGISEGTVAIVNREAISTDNFSRTYKIAFDNYSKEFKGASAQDMIASMNLPSMVLNNLIFNEIAVQQARNTGFIVTDEELRDQITHLPSFLNKDRQFDPRIYYAVLRDNSITPDSFQQSVKQDILTLKLKKLFFDSVFLNDNEAKILGTIENTAKPAKTPENALQTNMQLRYDIAQSAYSSWMQNLIDNAKATGRIEINKPLLSKFTQTSE